MRLVLVAKEPKAAALLYALLAERDDTVNISHRAMPTRAQHARFIRTRPYSVWYLIEHDGDYVGSIYLSRKDEIGVFVFKRHHGRGYGHEAVVMLMKAHPRLRYLANINPKNQRSIEAFARLGFTHIQNTYELQT